MLNLTQLAKVKEQYSLTVDMLDKFEKVFQYYETQYGVQYDTLKEELRVFREENRMSERLLSMYENSDYKETDVFIGMMELLLQELSIIYNQSQKTLREVIGYAQNKDFDSLRTLLISELRKKQLRPLARPYS